MASLIGLTGKSCSGKNYVSQYMEDMGWEVLDLDTICHGGIDQNKEAILTLFGTTDRKAISKLVFSSPEKLRALESILYPWLKKTVKSHLIESSSPFVVINGALLFRAGMDTDCKALVYVDASYQTRLNRAKLRDGIDENTFQKREESQKDVDYRDVNYRCPLFVVNNDQGCLKQLEEICRKISQL